MERKDFVVEAFDKEKICKTSVLPIICVYNNPSDYPGEFIARLWDMSKPTRIIARANILAELRQTKPADMYILPRDENDNKVIVETWI